MPDNNNKSNNGWIKTQPVFKKYETKSKPSPSTHPNSNPVQRRDRNK